MRLSSARPFAQAALTFALFFCAGRTSDAADPFAWRGYYFILSRNPGYGLDDYARILDRMAEDRANLLILWIGGGFPSKLYPETWDYNRGHRNVKENFAGALIDHAHRRGIRVLLGLTPFAYDGVNRYGAAHPELGASGPDGKPAVTGGIHSLGRGLCPSKPGAREFLRDYSRELLDLYPQADGMFLEHSDYGTCACASCGGGKGLRREWEFVEELARHLWGKKPEGVMMIYPQYAALGVEYDPRYVVFLAPHNVEGAEALKNPKVLSPGYWGEQGHFGETCRKAARAGYAGVVPSMENFTYENPHAFDTRWGPEGSAGWDDLLVRVARLTFREFCARPDLDPEGFRLAVKEAFFGAGAPEGAAGDLLDLHRILNRWEGWSWRGGVMKPPAERIDLARFTPEERVAFERETLPALRKLREIRARAAAAAGSKTSAEARKSFSEMSHIAGWVLSRWEGKLPAE